MAAKELSKFWSDIELAYTQVALNHEREITVTSESEGLTATVEYDYVHDNAVVIVTVGTDINKEGE